MLQHFAKTLSACAVVIVVGATSLPAGQFNEVLSIGDPAPAWHDLPGTDGKTHSLEDLRHKQVVVVAFTCASCPTAVDYEKRIGELAAAFADKSVAVVPICVNQVKQDKLDALSDRVRKEKLGFHYLHDETQHIAKRYGAIFTPEFFVLNAERKIVYMGAFDDATDPAQVKDKWVEQAVVTGLAGQQPKTKETVARGCRVRYARERK